MADDTERLVDAYLWQFEAAANALPPGDRDEAIRRVCTQLRRDVVGAELSPAAATRYLDRLGAPEELVGVAVATRRWRRTGFARAAGAAALLPTIWPLGVILLWRCDYWTRAEKGIASMAVPGGIPAALLLWPRLVVLAWGPRSVAVTGDVLFLVCAATAFYLGMTFVLRAEFGARPELAGT